MKEEAPRVSERTLQIHALEAQISDPNVSSRLKNQLKRKLQKLQQDKDDRPLISTSRMRMQCFASCSASSSVVATKQVLTNQPQSSNKVIVESVVDPLKAFEDMMDWPFHSKLRCNIHFDC